MAQIRIRKKSAQILQTLSDFNQKTFEYETKLEDLADDKSLNEIIQSANKTMEEELTTSTR